MSTFAHHFQVVIDAMHMDVHKMRNPFYTSEKMPSVTATITVMRFVGSNSQEQYAN